MTESIRANNEEISNEIERSTNMGDKRFHSETSLQRMGEDEDPGVLNTSVSIDDVQAIASRRRTMSQPGPVSGSLLTATAARAARKKPQRNVMYADDEKNDDEKISRLTLQINESGTATPIGDRSSPFPYNAAYRNGDMKSLNSYRLYATNSVNTPRKRSVATMDAQSMRSVETQAPPPTTPEQNAKLTKEYLTTILSCIYAILLVTLGLIIFLADPFLDTNVSPIYCLVLGGLGFLYLLIIIIDIGQYKSKALKHQKMKSRYEENLEDFLRGQEHVNRMSGDRTPVELFKSRTMAGRNLNPIKHDYCFSQGRHSGSFYLKLGATGFAMGHLVHSMLLITVQISVLMDDDVDNNDCVVVPQVILDIFYPLYCLFQLFFIFKYSNVIILKWQGLARFAFMHFIGSSLCFWLWVIVRETLLALALYAQSKNENNNTYESTSYSTHPTDHARTIIPGLDLEDLYDEDCVSNLAVSRIYQNFSPYLFPFSVEFNILIVGIYYIVWSNIGGCLKESEENDDEFTNSSECDNNTICKIPTASEDNDYTSNMVIHADCHASNRGLFTGMVIVVLLVGILILGFVFSSVGEDFLNVGYLLNDSTKLSMHILMLFVVVFAFNQSRKLDINEHSISLLDDILLFICLPAFFMETIFTMVATVHYVNFIKFADVGVMSLQIIIQTALIVDGLRRCSNSRKLRRNKPGRELMMFLIISNVGMWLFYTFSYKSPDSLDERYTFYGKVLWSILGHISLPLIMFYRFHSSVCFADIWDSAYKPGSEH